MTYLIKAREYLAHLEAAGYSEVEIIEFLKVSNPEIVEMENE